MEEADRKGKEDNKSKCKERATLEKVVLELEAAPALPRPAPSVPALELRAEGVERTCRGRTNKRKREEQQSRTVRFSVLRVNCCRIRL